MSMFIIMTALAKLPAIEFCVVCGNQLPMIISSAWSFFVTDSNDIFVLYPALIKLKRLTDYNLMDREIILRKTPWASNALNTSWT